MCPLHAPLWIHELTARVLLSLHKWADNITWPDWHATDLMVAHLFSCPTHPTDLAPWDMWTAALQVAQFFADLPQFSDLPNFQIDLDSLTLNPAVGPLPLAVPAGPLCLSSPLSFSISSSHFDLSSAIQQQLKYFRQVSPTPDCLFLLLILKHLSLNNSQLKIPHTCTPVYR